MTDGCMSLSPIPQSRIPRLDETFSCFWILCTESLSSVQQRKFPQANRHGYSWGKPLQTMCRFHTERAEAFLEAKIAYGRLESIIFLIFLLLICIAIPPPSIIGTCLWLDF